MTDNFAFLLPFFMGVFGILFISARRWSETSAGWWGLGYLASGLGFVMPLLAFLPPVVQALLAELFFFTGFFAYGEALAARFGVPARRRLRLAVVALATPFIIHAVVFAHDLHREVIVSDLANGILLLIPAVQVARRARHAVDRVLVCLVALVVVETFLRLIMFVFMTSGSGAMSIDDYLSSAYAFYTQMGAGVFAFLLALSILATIMHDALSHHRTTARQDPLSGLLNRRGFEQHCASGKVLSAGGAVIVGDIDHFKRINDVYGHAAGDAVIARFAGLIRELAPAAAVAARFGGEEFVVVLPGASVHEAGLLADTLRVSFTAEAWAFRREPVALTASFGVSALAVSDHTIHDAIQRADAKLYEAKSAGRNRVAVEGRVLPETPPPLKVVSFPSSS